MNGKQLLFYQTQVKLSSSHPLFDQNPHHWLKRQLNNLHKENYQVLGISYLPELSCKEAKYVDIWYISTNSQNYFGQFEPMLFDDSQNLQVPIVNSLSTLEVNTINLKSKHLYLYKMIKKYLLRVDQLAIRYQIMKIMHSLTHIKLKQVLDFLNLSYRVMPNQQEMRLGELSKYIDLKTAQKGSIKNRIVLNPEMNLSYTQQQLKHQQSISKLSENKNKRFNKCKINYSVSNISQQQGFYNPKYIPPKADMNFQINIQNVKSGFDKRTTLMIKNIPNKKTQVQVMEIINRKFQMKFNYFYLPIDFKYLQNVGYAFINFINYLDIAQFVKCFKGMRWPNTTSKKFIELTYARTQGIKQLVKNHKKSLVYQTQNDPKLMPVILKY